MAVAASVVLGGGSSVTGGVAAALRLPAGFSADLLGLFDAVAVFAVLRRPAAGFFSVSPGTALSRLAPFCSLVPFLLAILPSLEKPNRVDVHAKYPRRPAVSA
ncbi:hypothetical protein [Chelativorans sp.]|uniref:hypothetical protein n=1 Tax=Chelativorans sp. TaxID=2203393 RepID=UPI002811D1CA|nr:hypothetical protein [Chelativorans sp.]